MRLLTVLLATAIVSSTGFAGDPETPAPLLGRWEAQKIINLGEQQPMNEIRAEMEFTATQMHLRVWTHSEERPSKPTYIGDCYARSANELLMLDMKTAKDNPGPEKELEVLSIYKFDGDDLWISSPNSGDPKEPGPRPTGFVSSPESKSDLYVLSRVDSK